ncbi:AlkA N-terminal domain-containing protein, partial [Streptomyces sp. NPDC005568]|uniref:AlkA N-terminal domain-containing protein n=1 Tax=Streptomyces sp. NPDC005568 TaxID=3156887 RepID=UPI0033B25083
SAGRRAATPSAGIPLRLAHRGPYQSTALFDVLAREAVPGVEEVTGTRARRTYRRTLRLPYGTGIVAVAERPGGPARPAPAHPGGWLDALLHLTDLRDLTTAVQRLRLLFDLDADPYAVDERLAADPRLAPLVAARPGLRSPGTADPDELAVRALVGRAEAERLVQRYGKTLDAPCGTLTHLFPEAGVLAQAEPDGTLGALAAALADGTLRLPGHCRPSSRLSRRRSDPPQGCSARRMVGVGLPSGRLARDHADRRARRHSGRPRGVRGHP